MRRGPSPTTLAGVAEEVAAGDNFSLALGDFLDRFYAHPAPESLEQEPRRLAAEGEREGEVRDAYLAATAEWLAMKFGFPTPEWAKEPTRALRRPWFAVPYAGFRATLLLESPISFRCRNLFVTENALTRA
jgi:hypothetical protein